MRNQTIQKSFAEFDINGEAPEFEGAICDGFICEQFVYKNELIASANVTYLRFSDVWYRLYFDCGTIFWRIQSEEPLPWEVREEQFFYPHTDVGGAAGIMGLTLTSYTVETTPTSSRIEFIFSSDRRIVLEDYSDISSYFIV